jgi:hypothetical protein
LILARDAFVVEKSYLRIFGGQLGLEDLDLRCDLAPLLLVFAASTLHLLPAEVFGSESLRRLAAICLSVRSRQMQLKGI